MTARALADDQLVDAVADAACDLDEACESGDLEEQLAASNRMTDLMREAKRRGGQVWERVRAHEVGP